MSAIFYVAMAIVAVSFIHSAIVFADTNRIYKDISLIHRGIHDPAAREELRQREANPPWYQRYCLWLERNVPGFKGGAS